MCVVFCLISFVSFLGQCRYPFPGIADFIENQGCEAFVQLGMQRRIMLALHMFGAHYVQRLIFSGVYIEREMTRQQKN